MSKDSINVKAFVAGEELGHIAAMTAENLHPRAATEALVKTMMKVIETEPDEEAADYCMGAILAYTDGLKRTAEKVHGLDENEDENAPDESENEGNPLDALFGGVLGALADLCGALSDDDGDEG